MDIAKAVGETINAYFFKYGKNITRNAKTEGIK
jgi:hypothetical protein